MADFSTVVYAVIVIVGVGIVARAVAIGIHALDWVEWENIGDVEHTIIVIVRVTGVALPVALSVP